MTCFETAKRFRKDGPRVFVRIKRILIRDGHGGVMGILERGRALNSYGADFAAEGPLRSIMKQMPGIHWTTDRNLRITQRIRFFKGSA